MLFPSLYTSSWPWEECESITASSSQPKIRWKFLIITRRSQSDNCSTTQCAQMHSKKHKMVKYSFSHSFLLKNMKESYRIIFCMCIYTNISGRKTENYLQPLLLVDKEITSHAMWLLKEGFFLKTSVWHLSWENKKSRGCHCTCCKGKLRVSKSFLI